MTTSGCVGGGAQAACDYSTERTALPKEHAARLRAAPSATRAARNAQHVPVGVPSWHVWQIPSRGEAYLNSPALLAPIEARTVFQVHAQGPQGAWQIERVTYLSLSTQGWVHAEECSGHQDLGSTFLRPSSALHDWPGGY